MFWDKLFKIKFSPFPLPDIAFASGLPVLLLFLGFLLSTAWALLSARTPVALATLFALLTYLIYGLFWFATPNVDTLVWGLVGLGLGSLYRSETRPEHR